MKKTTTHLILLIFLCICSSVATGQQKRTVTGAVKDNKGVPVPSATVNVKGTTQSVITDETGHFSISFEKNNAVLVISSLGFATKEMVLNSM